MIIRFTRGSSVTLTFPNLSRSFNVAKRSIRFGGYDTVFEIAFELDADAFARMGAPKILRDEAGWLSLFDEHRERIERVASAVYAKQRSRFVRLEASHF